MWLPDSIYERAAHYWLLLGLLLIVVGTYLAIELQRGYLYISVGVGLSCCYWSMLVFKKRKPRRAKERIFDPELDQTCELNHNPKKYQVSD